jgi:peptide-methionine (S)-S-oxide reductase
MRRLALAAAVVTAAMLSPAAAEEGRSIPAPDQDRAAAGAKTSEVAVIAGGCFWGVQGVYQHVTGVSRAISGYAGGEEKTAQYDLVSRGTTGHAESVQITYDPQQISYGKILQIFFSVAHDPTQLNRQGSDVGTQYRSAIFPLDFEQARVARSYIAQLNKARVFDATIVTKIENGKSFYAAEAYHQDFMTQNPQNPYIAENDLPKIDSLKRLFPALYRDEPVLVQATSRKGS